MEDLQVAWETLEVARVILSRHETREARLALADVKMRLGDAGVEMGKFEDAMKDFGDALGARRELLGDGSR